MAYDAVEAASLLKRMANAHQRNTEIIVERLLTKNEIISDFQLGASIRNLMILSCLVSHCMITQSRGQIFDAR